MASAGLNRPKINSGEGILDADARAYSRRNDIEKPRLELVPAATIRNEPCTQMKRSQKIFVGTGLVFVICLWFFRSAVGILRDRKHSALPALTAEQLRYVDLQVRMLGLNYLKHVPPSMSVPTVIPILDDADPLMVTLTLKLLEKSSGENCGVKLSETASIGNEQTGLKEYRVGSVEKVKAGAERAKVRWAAHQSEYPPVHLQVSAAAVAARQTVPASDFQLSTLEATGSACRICAARLCSSTSGRPGVPPA